MYSAPPSVYAQPNRDMLGKVLGLLAFSMVFTAGGALMGPSLNLSLGLVTIISLVALLVLSFARSLPAPVRLGLLYFFCVCEGLFLGAIINAYAAAGMSRIVVQAAGTTGALTFALAGYAWVTKRDFSGWGSYLTMGLIGVIIASIIGIFVQATFFHLVLSAITAILFSGYLLYDVQRLKTARPGDDAIMLAVGIYLDILNLFWAILRILTILSGSKD